MPVANCNRLTAEWSSLSFVICLNDRLFTLRLKFFLHPITVSAEGCLPPGTRYPFLANAFATQAADSFRDSRHSRDRATIAQNAKSLKCVVPLLSRGLCEIFGSNNGSGCPQLTFSRALQSLSRTEERCPSSMPINN